MNITKRNHYEDINYNVSNENFTLLSVNGGLYTNKRDRILYCEYKFPWLKGIKLPLIKDDLSRDEIHERNSVVSKFLYNMSTTILRKAVYLGVRHQNSGDLSLQPGMVNFKGSDVMYSINNFPEMTDVATDVFIYLPKKDLHTIDTINFNEEFYTELMKEYTIIVESQLKKEHSNNKLEYDKKCRFFTNQMNVGYFSLQYLFITCFDAVFNEQNKNVKYTPIGFDEEDLFIDTFAVFADTNNIRTKKGNPKLKYVANDTFNTPLVQYVQLKSDIVYNATIKTEKTFHCEYDSNISKVEAPFFDRIIKGSNVINEKVAARFKGGTKNVTLRQIWYNNNTWKFTYKLYVIFPEGFDPTKTDTYNNTSLRAVPPKSGENYGFVTSPNHKGNRNIWDVSDAIPNAYVSGLIYYLSKKLGTSIESLCVTENLLNTLTSNQALLGTFNNPGCKPFTDAIKNVKEIILVQNWAQLFILCFPWLNIAVNTSQETVYNVKLSDGFIAGVDSRYVDMRPGRFTAYIEIDNNRNITDVFDNVFRPTIDFSANYNMVRVPSLPPT